MTIEKTTIAIRLTTKDELDKARAELYIKGIKFITYEKMFLEFKDAYLREVKAKEIDNVEAGENEIHN